MLVWKLADSGDDVVVGQWPEIEQTAARCNWCECRWWSVSRRRTHAIHLVFERPVELRRTDGVTRCNRASMDRHS